MNLNCRQGHLIEKDGPDNLPPGNFHFLVKRSTLDFLKIKNKSGGMFLWGLTKTLYSDNELFNKNFFGGKGKQAISPRRRHAMEHAFIDVFQTRNKAVFHKAVKSVNNGLYALTEKKNAA